MRAVSGGEGGGVGGAAAFTFAIVVMASRSTSAVPTSETKRLDATEMNLEDITLTSPTDVDDEQVDCLRLLGCVLSSFGMCLCFSEFAATCGLVGERK